MRLVEGEVMTDAGLHISEPESIGWLEVRRGDKVDENKIRNAVSLLHIAYLIGDYIPKEGIGFFAFDAIPEDTLGFHKFLISFFKRHLDDGKIILGK